MVMHRNNSRWQLALRAAGVIALAAVFNAAALAAVKTETVAHGLVNPWSLAFLPDGRMLVTERPGRLRIVSAAGQVSPAVQGVPAVAALGQCGLHDVVLDPRFSDNSMLYLSYAEPGAGGNSLAVLRARLMGGALTDVKVIFRQLPKVDSAAHCGGRLVFGKDGNLFITLGDRFARKDDAQTLANHLGKIVRIAPDGSVPADNPFIKTPGAMPEIWSLGHRNVQGAALHPGTGELWASEHGPQGGDELNLVLGGRNFGWPLVTYGRNYGTGTRIGEEGPKAGFEPPLRHWVPVSVAPSGLAFLTSERYPGWKGNLFMGTLRAEALLRLELDGQRVLKEERLLTNMKERIRDVRQGPDGYLYLLTDNADGRVLRLVPGP